MANVRVNSVYKYNPVLLDKCNPPHGARAGLLTEGQLVRVVNLPGCPRANTMGHCYIEDKENGKFLGMVCVNSLMIPA